jgi:hypothetical protein
MTNQNTRYYNSFEYYMKNDYEWFKTHEEFIKKWDNGNLWKLDEDEYYKKDNEIYKKCSQQRGAYEKINSKLLGRLQHSAKYVIERCANGCHDASCVHI